MPNPAAIGPNASPHSDRVGYCKVRAFGIGRTLFPPPHDRDVWKPLAVVAVAAVASAGFAPSPASRARIAKRDHPCRPTVRTTESRHKASLPKSGIV